MTVPSATVLTKLRFRRGFIFRRNEEHNISYFRSSSLAVVLSTLKIRSIGGLTFSASQHAHRVTTDIDFGKAPPVEWGRVLGDIIWRNLDPCPRSGPHVRVASSTGSRKASGQQALRQVSVQPLGRPEFGMALTRGSWRTVVSSSGGVICQGFLFVLGWPRARSRPKIIRRRRDDRAGEHPDASCCGQSDHPPAPCHLLVEPPADIRCLARCLLFVRYSVHDGMVVEEQW